MWQKNEKETNSRKVFHYAHRLWWIMGTLWSPFLTRSHSKTAENKKEGMGILITAVKCKILWLCCILQHYPLCVRLLLCDAEEMLIRDAHIHRKRRWLWAKPWDLRRGFCVTHEPCLLHVFFREGKENEDQMARVRTGTQTDIWPKLIASKKD
jgi:hypothetical protein